MCWCSLTLDSFDPFQQVFTGRLKPNALSGVSHQTFTPRQVRVQLDRGRAGSSLPRLVRKQSWPALLSPVRVRSIWLSSRTTTSLFPHRNCSWHAQVSCARSFAVQKAQNGFHYIVALAALINLPVSK